MARIKRKERKGNESCFYVVVFSFSQFKWWIHRAVVFILFVLFPCDCLMSSYESNAINGNSIGFDVNAKVILCVELFVNVFDFKYILMEFKLINLSNSLSLCFRFCPPYFIFLVNFYSNVSVIDYYLNLQNKIETTI